MNYGAWIGRRGRSATKRANLRISLANLEQQLGRPASEAEICAALRLSSVEYAALLDEIRPASFVPLDGEAYSEDNDDISLHDLIADDAQTSGRDELEKKELLQLVVGQLQKLPEMQKKVLAI